MNTPKIRFKGFTDDWEQRKLKNLIEEYKETVDSSCALPILTSSKTEGVILQEEHFGRKQNHDITGYNILPRNYCTYRNRSDGVDFTFNINKCCDKGIISKFYPVFCGKENDTFFISLVLNNSDEVVREIGYTCTGTGQKVLSFLDLQKMHLRVPTSNEQKKIAGFFTGLDDLITLHQRKCDETKQLKKFMLQKMFPKNGEKNPEIRFEGFTDDWEQRKLSELTTMHARIGWQNLRTSEFLDSGDYMLITGTDFQEGVIDYSTCHYVEKERYDQDKNIQIKNGSILITKDGTLGKVAYVQGLMMPATLNAGVFNVTIKNENIMDGKYLFQYLKAPFLMDYVSKKATGGTIKHLNQSILVDFPVAMPKREEQVKISRYFTALDNLITLHQRKCEKLKELKKFMLQNMFV